MSTAEGFLPTSSSDRGASKAGTSQALVQLIMTTPALADSVFYCFQSLGRNGCFQRSIQFWTHSYIHRKAWKHTGSRTDTESSLWKAQSLNSAKPSGEARTNTQVATFLWGTNFGTHLQPLHSADSDARGNQCSDAGGNTPPCLLYPQRQCLFRDHNQMRLSPLLASWAVFTTWATTPGTQLMNKLTHGGIYIKLNIIQP